MRVKHRNPAQRLRTTVDALPERTQRAMLRGIDRNRIIVGAYTDPQSGGICPMLAAHRNGGRTSLASFAIAWDAFTGARKPRLATRREVRTLRSYLVMSLLRTEQGGESLSTLASRIRAERAAATARTAPAPAAPDLGVADASPPAPQPGQIRITRSAQLRDRLRFRVTRRSRRSGDFRDLVAAAEAELSEPINR